MNANIDTLSALIVYEEWIKNHRDPITLGRPRKTRRLQSVDLGNVRSVVGIARALQSAVRAAANLLNGIHSRSHQSTSV